MANLEVDIGNIQPGNEVTVKWRGKPVFIRHRSAEDIAKAQARWARWACYVHRGQVPPAFSPSAALSRRRDGSRTGGRAPAGIAEIEALLAVPAARLRRAV